MFHISFIFIVFSPNLKPLYIHRYYTATPLDSDSSIFKVKGYVIGSETNDKAEFFEGEIKKIKQLTESLEEFIEKLLKGKEI